MRDVASEAAPSKDRIKLARKLAAVYVAAVALQSALEEVEGQMPDVSVELKGSTFSVRAGNIRYGSKFDGI